MFKKIVSQIPYSPSVVRSLGTYAKKLRKEKTSRQLGLIMILIALVIQLFIAYSPIESANTHQSTHQNEYTPLKQINSAINLSQNSTDATLTTAKPGDKIVYKMTASNINQTEETFTFKTNLDDILEYANIFETSGGHIQNSINSNILSWNTITLKPGETKSQSFTIKIKSIVPAMARSSKDRNSYDCRIDNTFGNTTSIAIDCPTPKMIEKIISKLPKVTANDNLLFAFTVFLLVVFSYLRACQLEKEVRIIRHKMSRGSL